MSIQILSASAGSGKTFYLSMFYIHIALKDKYNFKKILALTFTNAAVNEMKSRILEKLHALSKSDIKTLDEYRNFVTNELKVNLPTDDFIVKQAKHVLQNIVHRYHFFSVFTIDSFLQKVLSSCLYEIGVPGHYELVVDSKPLIEEAIENFLFASNSEDDVLQWIDEFISYRLDIEKSIHLKNDFLKLAEQINKEFFYFNQKAFEKDDFDKYSKITQHLKQFQQNFANQLANIGRDFDNLCKQVGFLASDFKNGERGFAGVILKKIKNFKAGSKIDFYKGNFLDFLNNGQWFANGNNNALAKFTPYQQEFENIRHQLGNLLTEQNILKYETYRTIEENIYNIGLIHKIVRHLNAYKAANSVVLLSDVARMLVDFINENYLFLYEKMGVRYEYFLIDEFQDTSTLQYSVLKPLMEESCSKSSNNNNVLLVGDVKQAIYRWRNGEWQLMSKIVADDFQGKTNFKPLQYNWRSLPNIINFNNLLFEELINTESFHCASNNYNDLKQHYPHNSYPSKWGYIKIIFENKEKNDDQNVDDEDNTNGTTSFDLAWLIDEIRRLREKNCEYIGILVRRNVEAQQVFQEISQHSDITSDMPVVSRESITYRNSLLVESIMYLLHYTYTSSSLSIYVVNEFLKKLQQKSQHIDIETLAEEVAKIQYMPLLDKIEYIYQQLLQAFVIVEAEKVFYFNFISLVHQKIRQLANNEVAFVKWYFQEGRDKTIVLTSKERGIYIETIHASKGLQYDAVIVPFINWTSKNNNDYLWIENKLEELKNELPTLLISGKKELEGTHFKEDFLAETEKKQIDDLNLLYVALTRAKEALICKVYEKKGIGKNLYELMTSETFLNKLIEIDSQESQVRKFYHDNVLEFGTLAEFQSKSALQNVNVEILEQVNIVSSGLLKQQHLLLKKQELRYTNQQMEYGVLVHAVLEQLNTLHQWEKYARKVLHASGIGDVVQNEIMEKLNLLFSSESKLYRWFGEARAVYSEQPLLKDKHLLRPDKIFEFDDKIIVIDFKTGEGNLSKYDSQLKEYADCLYQLYRNKTIEAYLLNIDNNEYREVKL